MLVKWFGVLVNSAPVPDVVLVDASQLLYHVVSPVAGTVGDLPLSFGVGLIRYPTESQKLVLFDRKVTCCATKLIKCLSNPYWSNFHHNSLKYSTFPRLDFGN